MNYHRNRLQNIFIILFGAALVLMNFGCHIDKSKPNFELIQDMMESPALKAQEFEQGGVNNGAMRTPPEGTQPVGFEPYKYANDIAGAAGNKNPLAGENSEEVLVTGQKYYTIHCAVCHGANGEGGEKLSVAETMALKPPAMTSAKVKGWTDGQIYHVITMGQGVMGPYAAHIPQKYRWQVVNYIRQLQK
jgi:mono/diheme cytochrome c family protein